jgi:hypothetical protein
MRYIMNLPSSEFFDTLGEYVYGYINVETGNFDYHYVGKGKARRSVYHIKTKGYNLDECYIIARNLEKFSNKPSLLLESYIIATQNPRDNSVSGHYKECFVMAKLSDLYAEYKKGIYDNFESLPDWYVDNYDKLKGNIGKFIITNTNVFLESVGRNGVYLGWYYSGTKPITLKFSFLSAVSNEKLSQIKTFLAANNINPDNLTTDTEKVVSRVTYNIEVEDVETAIELFYDFMN